MGAVWKYQRDMILLSSLSLTVVLLLPSLISAACPSDCEHVDENGGCWKCCEMGYYWDNWMGNGNPGKCNLIPSFDTWCAIPEYQEVCKAETNITDPATHVWSVYKCLGGYEDDGVGGCMTCLSSHEKDENGFCVQKPPPTTTTPPPQPQEPSRKRRSIPTTPPLPPPRHYAPPPPGYRPRPPYHPSPLGGINPMMLLLLNGELGGGGSGDDSISRLILLSQFGGLGGPGGVNPLLFSMLNKKCEEPVLDCAVPNNSDGEPCGDQLAYRKCCICSGSS